MNKNLRKTVFILAGLTVLAACAKEKEPQPVELSISGTIQLDPKLARRTKPSDVIFLIARPAEGGPPLAVERFVGNKYPIPFKVTQANLMIPRQVVEMPIDMSVRVDKDGDAMTRNPGDLTGVYEKNPIPVRADGVVITVNQVIQ